MHIVPMPFTAAEARKMTEEASDQETIKVRQVLWDVAHYIQVAAANGRSRVHADVPPLSCSESDLDHWPGWRSIRDRVLQSLAEAGYNITVYQNGGVGLSWNV